MDSNEIKEEYENLKEKLENNKTRIKKLEENEEVKEYIKLTEETTKLETDYVTISLIYKIQRMEQCHHIYIKSIVDKSFDGHRTDKTEYYYCPKCGLDTLLAEKRQTDALYRNMSRIYFNTRYSSTYIDEYECHPALAKKIYEGILKAHPNISDENLVKYFKVALHNIKINNEEEHIKHLGLAKNYSDHWFY